MKRLCPTCHQPYWRSHRPRLWVYDESGALVKHDEPVCLNCMKPKQALRVFVATQIRSVPTPRRRKA